MAKKEMFIIRLEDGTYLHPDCKCPKCKNKTLEKDSNDIHCWSCGTNFINKPLKEGSFMKHAELMKRHEFYESNKQAILSDVESIGRAATCKKWNISNGTLSQLLSRWEYKGREVKGRDTLGTRTIITTGIVLPSLPAFSNSWDPKIQERWLDIYEKLASRIPPIAEQSKQHD
jgi:ribosomal protein S27E